MFRSPSPSASLCSSCLSKTFQMWARLSVLHFCSTSGSFHMWQTVWQPLLLWDLYPPGCWDYTDTVALKWARFVFWSEDKTDRAGWVRVPQTERFQVAAGDFFFFFFCLNTRCQKHLCFNQPEENVSGVSSARVLNCCMDLLDTCISSRESTNIRADFMCLLCFMISGESYITATSGNYFHKERI